MAVHSAVSDIKMIDANGQISLGKQYAGRQVLVQKCEPGIWLVRMTAVIPDDERGLHADGVAADLQEALEWAHTHPASDAGIADLLERLRNEQDRS